MNRKIKNSKHLLSTVISNTLNTVINQISYRLISSTKQTTKIKVLDTIALSKNGFQFPVYVIRKSIEKINKLSVSRLVKDSSSPKQEGALNKESAVEIYWAAIYTIRDWTQALRSKAEQIKPTYDSKQLFSKVATTADQDSVIKAWHPESMMDINNMIFSTKVISLPEKSPERAVAVFLEHWCNKRFSLISDTILCTTNISKGERAYRAKLEFDKLVLSAFKIVSTIDQAESITQVLVTLDFQVDQKIISKQVMVEVVGKALKDKSLIDAKWVSNSDLNSHWSVIKSSLSTILFATELQRSLVPA